MNMMFEIGYFREQLYGLPRTSTSVLDVHIAWNGEFLRGKNRLVLFGIHLSDVSFPNLSQNKLFADTTALD